MKEAENEKTPELDRKKISRCHRGIYLGRSPNHADNVALVLNLTTGHITAQFHVVFDDNFETINSTTKDLENSFPRLFLRSRLGGPLIRRIFHLVQSGSGGVIRRKPFLLILPLVPLLLRIELD